MVEPVEASFDRMQYYLARKKVKQYEDALVKIGIVPAHFARENEHIRKDLLAGLPHYANITELRAIVEHYDLQQDEVIQAEFKVEFKVDGGANVRTAHGSTVVGTAVLSDTHYGPKAFGHESPRRKVRITMHTGAVFAGLYFPDTGHARVRRIKGANRGTKPEFDRAAGTAESSVRTAVSER